MKLIFEYDGKQYGFKGPDATGFCSIVDSDGYLISNSGKSSVILRLMRRRSTNSAIGGRVKYRLPGERWRRKV